MFECCMCGCRSLIWQSDFSFEDYGIDGEGIVSCWSCSNCGAFAEYYVSCEEDLDVEKMLLGEEVLDDEMPKN